jgi:hypothetical protein
MPIIRLRRRTTAGSPTGLLAGEPAVNLAERRLWVGNGSASLLVADGGVLDALGAFFTAPFLPSPSTSWRCLWPYTGAGTTIAVTSGRCYFIPFPVLQPVTLMDLGIEVSTAATGTAEVAIYAADGTARRPGTRLAYVSGLSTGATGVVSGAISVTLQPGLYWAALRCSAGPTLRGAAGAIAFGVVTGGNNRANHLFSAAAALSDPVGTDPTSLGVGTIPHIYARW